MWRVSGGGRRRREEEEEEKGGGGGKGRRRRREEEEEEGGGGGGRRREEEEEGAFNVICPFFVGCVPSGSGPSSICASSRAARNPANIPVYTKITYVYHCI